MIDKSNKYDILNLSAEDTDFLCLNSPLVCAKEQTVSSAEHRNGAFLLESNMFDRKKCNRECQKRYRQTPQGKEYNRIYNKKYHIEHKQERKEYMKEYIKLHPEYIINQKKRSGKYSKTWRINHPEYIKEWKKNNPDWIKNWRQSPEGKFRCKIHNLNHRLLTKDLNIVIVQKVYEDNIKKFGTLTCYLCLKPILFSKDHVEHKTPLSRGGTNEYNNLGIACAKCNWKKHTKTEVEYRKENHEYST